MESMRIHLSPNIPRRREGYARHQDTLAAIGEACQKREVEVEQVFRSPYEDLPAEYLAVVKTPEQIEQLDNIS